MEKFKRMLQMMEQQSAAALDRKRSARALWLNEWSRLFLRAFEPETRVAYTSLYGLPMELLAAFDVVPFDFEIAAAMIGTTELGVQLMEEAEGHGYSRDVCSFHRAALGASFRDELPEPDILLTTSHYCNGKYKTNEILARRYEKEPFLLFVPAEVSRASVEYVKAQLRRIAVKLGEISGRSLDEDRLREAVRSSNRARASHARILDLLRHRPAPWGGAELVSYSINGQLFNGTEVKERLNDEWIVCLEQRIEAGSDKSEEHRLFWFAWIPTYPCNLYEVLDTRGASVPLCENILLPAEELDEDDPFEGLALRCLEDRYVGSVTRRTQGLKEIFEAYGIDGAVLFATPACRQANGAFRHLQDSVEALGVPFLMLDMDIGDPRAYSPEQTRTRIEGFLEVLDAGQGEAHSGPAISP